MPETGYLAKPTEQLALPGALPSGELTPEGDVYTGWAEFEPLVGPRLRGWSQPTRILPQPLVPRLVSQLRAGPVTYTEQVLTVPVAGQPVVT